MSVTTDASARDHSMGESLQIVVVAGPPGAGKGTQCRLAAEELGAISVSTGDALREATRDGTPIGRRARAYLDRGELVPDDLVLELVAEELQAVRPHQSMLLDGFPRTVPQAEALVEMLPPGCLRGVVEIDAPEEVLVRRLAGRRVCDQCGRADNDPTSDTCACGAPLSRRSDDDLETVRHRFEVYRSETVPMLRWFSRQGLLTRVDGNRPPELVAATFRAVLQTLTRS